MNMNESVGRRLQIIRLSRNLSGAEFARRMDYSRANVNNIENGRYNINIAYLEKASLVLDVSIRDFFPEQEESAHD